MSTLQSRWHRLKAVLSIGFVLIGLFIAVRVLHRELSQLTFAQLRHAIEGIPRASVGFAIAATIGSYTLLSLYDYISMRHVSAKLSYGQVLFASFTAYVTSHNIGLASLSGSAMRFRIYTHFGLKPNQITELISFCGLTFWIGLCMAGGTAFVLAPEALVGLLHSATQARLIGYGMLALCGLSLLLSMRRQRSFRIWNWKFHFPSFHEVAVQIPLGFVDWMCSAAVVYFLLPANPELTPLTFLGIFLAAQLGGVISHVPGGLGVFESVVLKLLPNSMPHDVVLGALVLYRILYYLLPFALAVGLFAAFEVRARVAARHSQAGGVLATPSIPSVQRAFLPQLFGLATFLVGVMLLISGTTPPIDARLDQVREVLPLELIELSHLGASLVGAMLLVLGRGLQRRIRLAWVLSIAMALTGAGLSLLKGFDWEEASVLVAFAVVLTTSQSSFYRASSMLSGQRSMGWLLAWMGALVGTVLLALFTYKHVDYQHSLWWQYSLHGNAPRALRALVGSGVVLTLACVHWLMRPAMPRRGTPSPEVLERVRAIVKQSAHVDANLALTGDKEFLFSTSGQSVLMYAVSGPSWISIGPPLGKVEERLELIERLRELSDWYGGRIAFDHVAASELAGFQEVQMVPIKIGERARVALADWTLEGRAKRHLRSAQSQMQRAGATFEVLAPGVADLAELRAISDAWLESKRAKEKAFSLGAWDDAYIAQSWIACVRLEGRIVAFANLWSTDQRVEVSVDLMRYGSDAPNGMMDFLFVELLLWGRAQGYQWFDLGVAPLAGIASDRTSPVWNALAGFVYRFGGRFYHFDGLQRFKQKFGPEWESVYLLVESKLDLPFVLADLTLLISRGESSDEAQA